MYPVIDPNIKNNATKLPYYPQNGVIHYFDLNSSNKNGTQNITCFNRQNDKSWSKSSCSTRINVQKKQAQCICNDLTPTTVIQDVSSLFENNKNIDTVFSSKGVNSEYLYSNIPKQVSRKSKIYSVSQQIQFDKIKPNSPTDQANINFTIKEEDDEKETPKNNFQKNLPNNISTIYKLELIQNIENKQQTIKMKKIPKIQDQEENKQNKKFMSEELMRSISNGEQIKTMTGIQLIQNAEQNFNKEQQNDQNQNNKNINNEDFSHSDLFESDANISLGKNNQDNMEYTKYFSQTTIRQSAKNFKPSIASPGLINFLSTISLNNYNKDSNREKSKLQQPCNQKKQKIQKGQQVKYFGDLE
ncbi:hypothetical protein TTHERM_00821850 (macronuclear) [Tetrahymena thermophila SB210]|uniref:Uncharacterized protein n=1 Tax=Tetrahymena thermophila (strain SB210) TaxID=312017 RepID=Q22F23_TETTS|nr:hypothetical protein TTHERM_00821850 [Tetrahymena thermophila SB210]EAR83852.2 hypothetical protein TTHERM_00821850 [Tetrahymena thermophila SB210]|eukprot:XP_001031515.2 hypothetical protein TTHERM_00821850 [Tetrahymena thermophila SB210]